MNTNSIFAVVERMAALLRSEERKKCTAYGLQAVHLQVLDYLNRCNKYSDTPAALANYLGMTRGTVSQTVLLLSNKGYIKKTTDSADRRVVHLSLRPEGLAVMEKARLADLFHRATDLLPKEDLTQYDDALVSVLNALQKSNQSHTFGLCKTCKYFTLKTNGYLCGLTQEPLTDSDSEQICQEHKVA
jgi:MarR family transcriptional regulator, negative regulator of the multidrug operon emrRAB